MKIFKKPFGKMPDGSVVSSWLLETENGICAEVIEYGATLRMLKVPDRNGKLVDVVLGYDDLESYLQNRGCFGGTVGRFANRIRNASYEWNGIVYQLEKNSGENHIHGGSKGFDKQLWYARKVENGVCFYRLSPEGEGGYPGNLEISVTYSLNTNALELNYRGRTDKDTIINLTNHTYFNLNGKGDVQDHYLQINADTFTVNDEESIPSGEIADVKGTAMDFQNFHKIGEKADSKESYVALYGGYDTNFVLNGKLPSATVYSLETGIEMRMITDQPGVQLYTANNIYERKGKRGLIYGHRSGFCLETQHFPDCIHHPEWESCVLRAGESFETITKYEFYIRK